MLAAPQHRGVLRAVGCRSIPTAQCGTGVATWCPCIRARVPINLPTDSPSAWDQPSEALTASRRQHALARFPLVYGSTSGANGYGLALHDHGLVHEPRLVRSHLHVPRYCRWAPLAHTQLQQSTLDPVNSECQPRLPTREHCTSFSHRRRSGRACPLS